MPLASAPPLTAEMSTEPAPPLAVSAPMFMSEAEPPRSMLRKRRVAMSPTLEPRTRLATERLPATPLPASTTPPLATLTAPRNEPAPRRTAAEATWTETLASAVPPKEKVPPFTLTATVPVRAPVGPMVNTPVPDLMSRLVPEPATAPPKAVLAPTVSSPVAPRATAPPVAPAPSRVRTDWTVPSRSKVAPATSAKRTVETAESTPVAPALSVPPSRAVSIEKV